MANQTFCMVTTSVDWTSSQLSIFSYKSSVWTFSSSITIPTWSFLIPKATSMNFGSLFQTSLCLIVGLPIDVNFVDPVSQCLQVSLSVEYFDIEQHDSLSDSFLFFLLLSWLGSLFLCLWLWCLLFSWGIISERIEVFSWGFLLLFLLSSFLVLLLILFLGILGILFVFLLAISLLAPRGFCLRWEEIEEVIPVVNIGICLSADGTWIINKSYPWFQRGFWRLRWMGEVRRWRTDGRPRTRWASQGLQELIR